ncbi:MAG: hypothetical protein Q4E16_05700 [Neisseria sp.]|nr:hypothetical protein [Neisseria sp.]
MKSVLSIVLFAFGITFSQHAAANETKGELPQTATDIKIINEAPSSIISNSTPNASNAENTGNSRLQIKLRKGQKQDEASVAPNTPAAAKNTKTVAPQKAPIRRAAPIRGSAAAASKAPAVVQSKPKLSRAQVVQQELNREKTALARLQNQLKTAQQKGENTSALQNSIRDRQASIRALQAEVR